MPTIVGILTFDSGFDEINLKFLLSLAISVFMSSLNFMLSRVEHEICFITLGPGHFVLYMVRNPENVLSCQKLNG